MITFKLKRAMCVIIAAVLLTCISPVCFSSVTAETGAETERTYYSKTYDKYIAAHQDGKLVTDTVNASPDPSATVKVVDGKEAVIIEQGGSADYTVSANKTGWYRITLDYNMFNAGNGVSGQIRIALDGQVVCQEMDNIVLRRIWKDDGKPQKNYADDELQPDITEIVTWQKYTLHDSDGMTDSDFLVYLETGEHKITLTSLREDVAITDVVLGGDSKLPDYKTVKAEYDKKGYKAADCKEISIRAEYSSLKSEQNLIMTADYSSASTTPSDPKHTVLNTIGGESWIYPGQWISWDVDVPESGLYKISFKYRQDYQNGMNVYRSLAVDGSIPFKEASAIEFSPKRNWTNLTVSDKNGEAYLFYLEKGKHSLTLDVTFEPMADALSLLQSTIEDMNAIYRKVFTVTGSSVDTFRDYEIEKEIPGLVKELKNCREKLEQSRKSLLKVNKEKSPEISLIDVAIEQMDKFIKNTKKIPNGLDSFKNNIASLADAMLTVKKQPLLLDQIYVSAPDGKVNKPTVGFFKSMVFNFRSFLTSFSKNYVKNTASDKKVLEVWVSTGKDQMVTLDQLIQNDFVPKSGIEVNLSLINDVGTLTKAIMGNAGPDCALMLARGTPINYSMRNALVDLSKFDGFDEVVSQFQPTATVPYQFKGGVFALPETQVYQMMFYRADIFAEMGIEPPDTWEDLYKIVTKIERSNMQVGIPPESHQIFQTLLLQAGGTYFNDDLSKTAFTSEPAIKAFTQWTDFYNKYGLPVKYDAFNRFRTGEVPIVINAYTFYNQLSIAAPEIRGLWKMAPIPGTKMEDGTVNRKQTSDGAACIIIDDNEENTQEFEFLKWWVSASTQAAYALKIENRLGESGRYTTANKEAFNSIPWSVEQQEQLINTWNDVEDIPIVPGNYYIDRNITNAFRGVVYKKLNQRETLLRYNKDMNNEIARKRKEFGF